MNAVRPIGAASLVVGLLVAMGAADAQRELRERRTVIAVLDRDGAPVQDLGISDIVVREDGIAREVLQVQPAPPPTHIGLLVDDSQAVGPAIREVRQAVTEFLAAEPAAGRSTSVGITTFGDRPTRLFPYSQNPTLVGDQVTRIFPRPGAGATLVDAIVFEARELRQVGAERPLLVAFVVEDGPEFSSLRHTDAEAALREIGASLWPVVLQSRGGEPVTTPEARERALVLSDVAEASGGQQRPVLSPSGLAAVFSDLARLIAGRVEVTYGRPDSLIPPSRLAVEVRRPDLRILASEWVRP